MLIIFNYDGITEPDISINLFDVIFYDLTDNTTVMYTNIDSRFSGYFIDLEKVMFCLVCEVMHRSLINHIRVSYLQCCLSVEGGQQGKEKDKS